MNTIIQCPTCKIDFDYVNGEDIVSSGEVEPHNRSNILAIVCICGEALFVNTKTNKTSIITVSELVQTGMSRNDVVMLISMAHDNWQISRKEKTLSA